MRYLVLSDIHSNLAALEAVLADAGRFDSILNIGDVVGYGPSPNECIARLQAFPHISVMGNHDCAALGQLKMDDFNQDARYASLWTRGQLNDASFEFLETLPTQINEAGYTIVHGSPREPVWEYILYPMIAAVNFPLLQTDCCFVGHTHVPIIFEEPPQDQCIDVLTHTIPYDQPISLASRRLIINPGSVGQPRDGDARACYLLLDTESQEIIYRRVDYAIHETQTLMLDHDLPRRLVMRLSYGW